MDTRLILRRAALFAARYALYALAVAAFCLPTMCA